MLSKFSVRKPFTIVVAVIVVLIMGGISFTRMTTDLLPSMELPYVVVMTTYPGASPEEVEMMVTKPIEQALATTSNVENISSVSQENSSMVILEFAQSTNMDSAVIEMNSALDLVEGKLADEVGSPMLLKLNPNMMPIMVSAVNVDGMELADVSRVVNDTVLPRMEKIEGVASVSASGLLQETLQVSISQEKIDELNKKILQSVDAELAETQEKLDDAEAQLNDGKAKLNTQSAQQTKALEEQLTAVTQGMDQLAPLVDQARAGYDQATAAVQGLQQQIDQLDSQIEEKNIQITALEAMGASATLEQTQRLTELTAQRDALLTQKDQLQTGLAAAQEQLSQAQAGKEQLEGQLTQATDAETQLVAAQDTLKTELSKARSQINSGLATLKEQRATFDEARDEAYKEASLDGVITAQMISGILSAENFAMPAGYISTGGEDMLVKVGDKIADADEMDNLLLMALNIDGLEEVRLKDVADVAMIDNADDSYTRVNGNPGVVLVFQKQSTASTATVCQSINDEVAKLIAERSDIHVSTLMNQGMYIDIVIDSVLQNLLMGGGLAILILLLFLWDIRPTAIIAVSIPFSLVFAVALMYFTGVTLNVISLAGLALGVGMLVDNSIVVIENIYRMRNLGVSAREAAIEGARQVAGAITASTLTTVCVFLPIVFVEGISRDLFADMGLTIAYSLLASLIVALTLVPTMASGMLRRQNIREDRFFSGFRKGYGKALGWTLKHKAWVLILSVLLLFGSVYGVTRMGTAFMPKMDNTQMTVNLEMPREYTQQQKRDVADEATQRLLDIEDIQTIGVLDSGGMMGGLMTGGGGSGQNMSMYVILKEDKTLSSDQMEQEILNRTADLPCTVTVQTSNMDMTMLGGQGIEIQVMGDDLDVLKQTAQDVEAILLKTEGIDQVEDSLNEGADELRISVDKEEAMRYGLTVAQVFSQVSEGITDSKSATTLTMQSKEYPVIVMKTAQNRITADELSGFMLEGTQNEDGQRVDVEVRLDDIATITPAQGFDAVRREDQQRYVSVTATLLQGYNIGLVSRDFEQALGNYQPPAGVTLNLSGENETINSSLRDLLYMILLAVVLIYLIMVAQFQSLLSPFIVMFTIPLAFTGGLLALQLSGMELSIVAMLGFLVLAGIVVNNGIVFVDYANQLIARGMDKREALVETGMTRLRPILMTALTTVLGLSTMALGIGSGADMLQPMAVTTIGGLTYATVLTLFIVPSLYDLLHPKRGKVKTAEQREAPGDE